MPEDFKPTDIWTIADGAIPQLFEHALKRIVENIDDPNTDASAKRSLVVKVEFTPNAERSEIGTVIKTETKLVGARAYESTVFVVRRGGKVDLMSPALKQADLFVNLNTGEVLSPK